MAKHDLREQSRPAHARLSTLPCNNHPSTFSPVTHQPQLDPPTHSAQHHPYVYPMNCDIPGCSIESWWMEWLDHPSSQLSPVPAVAGTNARPHPHPLPANSTNITHPSCPHSPKHPS